MKYTLTHPLNTFDQVKHAYESTKPMRGKHAGKDVRPLAERRMPWNRIVKMDDNTYLLSTYTNSDPVFGYTHFRDDTAKVITPNEQVIMAPIVWRKNSDGSETVTVRNSHESQAVSYYNFLGAVLPDGLCFVTGQQGKHYIAKGYSRCVRYYRHTAAAIPANDRHYLAKSRSFPQYIKVGLDAQNRSGYSVPHALRNATFGADDGSSLTFKRLHTGGWEFLSGGAPEIVRRKRVQVEEKRNYKAQINQLFTFAMAMIPMLPMKDYDYLCRMEGEVWAEASLKENGASMSYYNLRNGQRPAQARAMLSVDHPFHLHLVVTIFRSMIHNPAEATDAEYLKAMRAEFTRTINKVCGFTYTAHDLV